MICRSQTSSVCGSIHRTNPGYMSLHSAAASGEDRPHLVPDALSRIGDESERQEILFDPAPGLQIIAIRYHFLKLAGLLSLEQGPEFVG